MQESFKLYADMSYMFTDQRIVHFNEPNVNGITTPTLTIQVHLQWVYYRACIYRRLLSMMKDTKEFSDPMLNSSMRVQRL